MKKLLIIAIIAALLITGGVYAFTFTTATTTIGVSAAESDFATVTAGNITAPTVFGNFTGTWPEGTLFTITPNASYTGDLVIRVDLVNAGQLIRQYNHMNMSLSFTDNSSAVSDEQGTIQVLNLQNGTAFFTWANGTGTGPYKVVLSGGSYKLHPWKSLSGSSVQPQLFVEVTQR
jgi:hypothetical protein